MSQQTLGLAWLDSYNVDKLIGQGRELSCSPVLSYKLKYTYYT